MGFSKTKRARVYEKYNNACVYCGSKPSALDHVIPRDKGGSDCDDNLVPSCRSCNSCKSNGDLELFRVRLMLLNSKWYGLLSPKSLNALLLHGIGLNKLGLEEYIFHFESHGYNIGEEEIKDISTLSDLAHSVFDAMDDSELSSTQRLLMVVISMLSNEEGISNPSYAMLRRGTGMSQATVAKHIKSLTSSGWISYKKGSGYDRNTNTYNNTNEYQLNIGKLDSAKT